MPTVNLYRYKPYIQLLRTNHGVGNTNYPMIQYDIKLYKGVTNTLDFLIRNNDRKPIKLVDYQIMVDIQNTNLPIGSPPQVLLSKQAIITDEISGKAQLLLAPGDIGNWNTGFYTYAVRTVDGQGRQEYLYTDVNKNAQGQFQLLETISASLSPAKEILGGDFTPTPLAEYRTIYVTGSIPGDAQMQQANGTHTLAIYLTDFTGKFYVEGSLSNDSPQPSQWFSIPLAVSVAGSVNLIEQSGVKQFTFLGNYYWVRFKYTKDPVNTGSFLKLLYKN